MTLLHTTVALRGSACLYYTLPWFYSIVPCLYLTLHNSTTFYHSSTWLYLTLLFDRDGRTVDLIEAEHQMKGQTVCCQEVFKLWLKGPDATWGNLIELLIDCEQTALAEQVKDALGL